MNVDIEIDAESILLDAIWICMTIITIVFKDSELLALPRSATFFWWIQRDE